MTNTPNSGVERYITPEFWSTPRIDTTSALSRLLYIALHTWADDHGRGLLDPEALNKYAFPYDAFRLQEIVGALNDIWTVFPVTYYTVNGVDYYQIDDWTQTQGEPNTPPTHPGPDHPDATQIP